MNSQMLGELEKEIMEVIWQVNSKVTVKDVVKVVSKKRKVAYTTIMTIMGRLVNKDLLKRTASGKAYSYQLVVSKDKFLTRISRQIIKNFISSFGDAAVAHFARELEKIPVEKKRNLLKLLKEADVK